MRRVGLNIIEPVLLGGNTMVPLKRRIKSNIIKPVLLGGNIMVPMKKRIKQNNKTCITRWEYNGSYE